MYITVIRAALKNPIVQWLVLTVLLATAGYLWWGHVAAHYRQEGIAECQRDHRDAVDAANAAQLVENERQRAAGDRVARDAAGDAATVTARIDATADNNRREVQDVYRNPPSTRPIAVGSCVHPVDDRVQSGFERAVRDANS